MCFFFTSAISMKGGIYLSIVSACKPLFQYLVHGLRIGAASSGFHHLSYKEAEVACLSLPILIDSLRILVDDLRYDLFDLIHIRDLNETFFFDDRLRRLSSRAHLLHHRLRDLSRNGALLHE